MSGIESIDPLMALYFFLFMCGVGLGLIVGCVLGFDYARHRRAMNELRAEAAGLRWRLFTGFTQ